MTPDSPDDPFDAIADAFELPPHLIAEADQLQAMAAEHGQAARELFPFVELTFDIEDPDLDGSLSDRFPPSPDDL